MPADGAFCKSNYIQLMNCQRSINGQQLQTLVIDSLTRLVAKGFTTSRETI